MKSTIKCGICFCLLSFVLCGCTDVVPSGSVAEPDPDYQPPENRLTEFEFTDQLGKPFNSSNLKGKVWLGSFFFADCPSICVQQNTQIGKLHKRFSNEDVIIVGMTVAPDKDSPGKLWNYGQRFAADHNTWKFLTGKDIEYVRRVGEDIFGLPAADETHTSDVVVFDRNGKIHNAYDVTDDREFAKCVEKITELLAKDVVPAKSDGKAPVEGTLQTDSGRK